MTPLATQYLNALETLQAERSKPKPSQGVITAAEIAARIIGTRLALVMPNPPTERTSGEI